MKLGRHKRFYEAVQDAHIAIHKVAEIGVFRYSYSVVREFIEAGTECHLYEPVPTFCAEILPHLAPYPNTTLYQFGLSDKNTEIDLYLAGDVGASTYAANQSVSPAILNDNFTPDESLKVTVSCRDIREVDPGDYDLVSIDVEGAEWPIIKHMISRPKVLAIETHFRHYKNPNLQEISTWANSEGYQIWYLDDSDTIFYRGTPPKLSLIHHLKTRSKIHKIYSAIN